ncbi:helix-turn-helix domain-containing protein [Sphingomonas sp.]|uniref:helix-turn-helix domain-containing protein n=1 Tax=Sphingomonas sp. TaxID=28214 RepID=UPI002EDA799B
MADALLLTEDEAAARLQICGRTLRRERQAGNVRYILIGRCVRYHPDDLDQLIEVKRTADRPKPTKRTGKGGRKIAANHGGGVIVPFSERQRSRR